MQDWWTELTKGAGGPLKWLWIAATFALIGLIVTPGEKRAWTEIVVAFFVAVAVAVMTGEIAQAWGAARSIQLIAVVMSALIGRSVIVFLMRLSHKIVTDDEIYNAATDAIVAWLKKRMKIGENGK